MGQLPYTNLSINQIRREVVCSPNMLSIGNTAVWPPLPSISPYEMNSYRGFQTPSTTIEYTQNDGGIWDGCNYWDVFCYMEGYSPEGSYCDPDFGYVGAYWTQNGCSMGYSGNSERGCGSGTELTFGGGKGHQVVHGNFTVQLHNVMIPQYTYFCTPVYLSIWVNRNRVACVSPNTHDYTDLVYYLNLPAQGGGVQEIYEVEYRVDYGFC